MSKVVFTALAACLVAVSMPLYSKDYPTKTITVIVPTAPGGSTDVAARIMAPKLSELLGQPVIVDNRAGAGGIIGTQLAAKATPDGHTLIISANQIAIAPALYKTPPYDLVKNFIPITSIGRIPTVLVANPELPVASVDELISLARRNPNSLTFGSGGIGSPNHLFGVLLNNAVGVQMLHVPYKGVAAAVTDVMQGRVSLAYVSLSTVQSFITAGRLKALAVTSSQRVPSLPNVPTIAESVPGYSADIWIGLWAVADTPAPVIEQIHAAALKTLSDATVLKRFAAIGMVIEPRSMAEFRSMVQAELDMWSTIVRKSPSIELQ